VIRSWSTVYIRDEVAFAAIADNDTAMSREATRRSRPDHTQRGHNNRRG
jgi:hypothetical protein